MKNTTTTKRAYKHSEAWLAKHAAKADVKKEAKVTEKKSKADVKAKKPMKKVDDKKAAAKAEAKKLAKEKKLAKAAAKKLAREKKLAKIAAKKHEKDVMKQAKKLFLMTKKSVSAIKKQTKEYGKFLSEICKNKDAQMLSKVTNLFARIGYSINPGDNYVRFENTAKVKLPKVKKEVKAEVPKVEKTEDDDITPCTCNPCDSVPGPEVVDEKPVVETSPVEQPDGPSDSDLNDIEEEAEVDDEVSQLDDDTEDDPEDNVSVDDYRAEPDMFDQSGMRDREEAFREMEEAQRDNGDWDA